jgi:5'-nucleotidase
MLKRVHWLLALCILASIGLAGTPAVHAQSDTTTVTILHFSDYHSHAVPFYSEGAPNQGGIARGIAYLKAQRQSNPNVLVLDGGDMVNKGSPTWSDEYQCAEWPWLNGIVDAMALGNHEFDYGQDVFKACQAGINYPILSANYLGADGKPLLTADGKTYMVKDIGGVKIGLFALAGSDFNTLVPASSRAPGATFADRIATAKQIVDTLRNTEKVNAVVFFGHELREDDYALAQAVPGIDLILGTHSHYKSELVTIPNTKTYFISPFQYLTYISNVQLTFTGGQLSGVSGRLVKMDAQQPEDPQIAAQVAKMQTDLEAKHPDRFKVLGTAAVEMSVDNVSDDETGLGNWSMEAVRAAAGVNAFFSTSSSFRASIPPGPITVETFYTAIPYKNSVVTADMTGQQLTDLLNVMISKRGSDSFCQESGVRFTIQDGKATNIEVLRDPANPAAGYAPLDPTMTYKIGATNFMTGVSAIYKPVFAAAANVTDTKVDIGTLLTNTIQSAGTVTTALDGRMGTAAPGGGTTPGMPRTGNRPAPDGAGVLLLAALGLLAAGLLVRRRSPAELRRAEVEHKTQE